MLALVSMGLGIALAAGYRQFSAPGLTNSRAGFLHGACLLVIRSMAFMARGRQTVVIDPSAQRITIEDSGPFGSKRRSIGFGDVTGVTVGYLGKTSLFFAVTFHYLLLDLKSGERYTLFAPGRFYIGASDRSVVESWRQRLEEYVSGNAVS